MARILVFGANGQLGHCLKKVAEERAFTDLVFPEEKEANIVDVNGLRTLFGREKPTYVVNCAAYTAVDKAEDELDICRQINKEGAANLAKLCKQHGSILVHVSTDFVFDGIKNMLLTEEDETNPISIYGLTKLEGEREIQQIWNKYYILRTSWLYSEYGNNFTKTMLRLGSEREELNIIADQIGTPTYAIDLAGTILDIIASERDAYGIYHYSNEGAISWYDFAKGIFDISYIKVKVNPIPTSAYPTRAKRPSFSVMEKKKIKHTFNLTIPYWRDSLAICIKRLQSQSITT